MATPRDAHSYFRTAGLHRLEGEEQIAGLAEFLEWTAAMDKALSPFKQAVAILEDAGMSRDRVWWWLEQWVGLYAAGKLPAVPYGTQLLVEAGDEGMGRDAILAAVQRAAPGTSDTALGQRIRDAKKKIAQPQPEELSVDSVASVVMGHLRAIDDASD